MTTHPNLLTEARRCTAFVLVATPGAVTSENVAAEVTACLSTGRYILTIDVDGSMKHVQWADSRTAETVRTMPSEEENGDAIRNETPRKEVVDRVLEILGYETQTRRIRRIVRRTALIGLAVVAGAYAFSAWRITTANQARDRAVGEATAAESRSIEARARQTVAEANTIEAKIRENLAALTTHFAEGNAWLAEQKTLLADVRTQVAQRLEADARIAAARQQEIATGLQLANDSSTILRTQPHRIERAVRLATEAMTRLERQGVRALAADLALRESLPLLPAVDVSVTMPGSGTPIASEDGRYVANTGLQGLSLCETNTGRCDRLGDASPSWSAVAFSGDANVVAAAKGNVVFLFSTETGQPLHLPLPFNAPIGRIAIATDGKTIAVAAGSDFSVRDATTNQELAPPRQIDDEDIVGMELSHDEESQFLLTVHGDRALVWKWRTKEPPVQLPTKGRTVWATFAPDDRRVATIDTEQGLVVSKWKWPQATESWTASLPPFLHTARFSPDGKRIAASRFRGWGVHVYDSEQCGAPVVVLDVPGRWLAFGRDGSTLATGSKGVATLWSLPGGRELGRAAHDGMPGVAFRDDGRLVSFDPGGKLRVWRRNPIFPDELRVATSGHPYAMLFEPSTHRLLLTTRPSPREAGAFHRIDRDGSVQPCPLLTSERVSSMAFTPDGLLVTGSTTGTVRLWESWCDATTVRGTEIANAAKVIDALAIGDDGSRLAIAADDVLMMIDSWRGAAPRSFTARQEARSRSIVFTPRGDVVTGGVSGLIRLWPWRGERAVDEVSGGWLTSLASPPTGRFVVSGGVDGATVWDVDTGTSHVIEHDAPVLSVAFDPTGRYLVTAGADQMAHVWMHWNREDAEEVARVTLSADARREETDGVRLAAFSADGSRLAVVTQRENPYVYITLWQPRDMLEAARLSIRALMEEPR